MSDKKTEQQELNVFQMYLDEIGEITACDEAENTKLLKALEGGSSEAAARLMEGNLKYVLGLTRAYLTRGVQAGDLVQEANMALVMAVNAWGQSQADLTEEAPDAEKGAVFLQFLEQEVKQALDDAVEQQSSQEKVEEKMVARVNVLKDLSAEMAEELGREATVEELAERLSMTVEEVKDIMKLTLDAMSVHGEEYEEPQE